MKISVVTISFNQGRFLEEAMRSVLEQDCDDVEYIVVDPGSTDGSREIIDRYRPQIAKVIFEPDSGPGDGLNRGFAQASGEIYGYLNADDVYLPGVLRRARDIFARRKYIDVLSAHCYIIDENGRTLQKAFSHRFDLARYAAGCCVLIQQSTFFRSRVFRRTPGFNSSNRISWDGELAVELGLLGARFEVVQDYWSCFRIYPESLTGSEDQREKHARERERIAARIGLGGMSESQRKFLWVTGWLGQPMTLGLRLIDGIVHPVRRV